jgi:hypothetical protein
MPDMPSLRTGSLVFAWLAVAPLAGCARATAAAPDGFALVELFTSEGCSSCPPADDVLGQLTLEAARDKRPVYTLAFHVDYWDGPGFRDAYSASWATQQQRAYAAALASRGLYTPQMVVNGHDEFIGSHAAQARASIAAEIAQPRSSQLRLSARRDPERVVVHYQLSTAPAAGAVLRLALVEAEAVQQIDAGENAGRRLRHVHVVRAFQTVALDAKGAGDASLAWPADFTRAEQAGAQIVGYVQQRATMAISAAASISVPAAAG